MNKLLKNINQAGVQILCTGVLGLVVFASQNAMGASATKSTSTSSSNTSAAQPGYSYNPQENCRGKEGAEFTKCLNDIANATTGTNTCKDSLDKITEAKKEIGRICGEAGLGQAKTCIEDAMECDEFITEGSGLSSGGQAVLGAATTLSGVNLSSAFQNSGGGGCPQLGGQDYFEQKKTLDDKIDDLNKETAEITQEIADANSDYKKEVADLQKQIQQLQADYKKFVASKDEELQQQMKEADQAEAQARDTLGQSNVKLSELRNQIQAELANQTAALASFSSSAMKSTCMAKYNEQAAALKKLYTSKSSSLGSYTSQQKQYKQAALGVLSDCMKGLQIQRNNTVNSSNGRLKSLQIQVTNLEENIANQQTAMKTAADNKASIQTANTKAKSDEAENVSQQMTQLTQQMNNAQSNLSDKLTALGQKQKANAASIQRVNAQISDLDVGGVPKKGTTMSVTKARGEISAQVEAIADAMADSGAACTSVQSAGKALGIKSNGSTK